jgi:hypothetical protein
MEKISQIKPDQEMIDWSVLFIEKIHRCADCPIRNAAIKKPKSIFARLHIWHSTWWPGWQAHQARACVLSTRTKTQN